MGHYPNSYLGDSYKGLNERISNRQKDFYLNEQNLNREAKELAKNYSAKIPEEANANSKLPLVGETKGYENQDVRISTGAENVALYPKLKEQLMMENIYNLGKLNPKLREVTEQLDKLNGNINYGISGISTITEANRLGVLWVGDNATEIIDRGIVKGWMSQDKTRVYRFPSDKLHAKQSVTKFQANFETYKIDPISKERIKIGNAHLDVKD